MSGRNPTFGRRQVIASLFSVCAMAGGAYALSAAATDSTASSGTMPADLAGSQALEQQLVDQIGQSQSAVLAALQRRNAAVTAYANATGSATLKVSQRRIVSAPATHAKTGASGGGASEREFEND